MARPRKLWLPLLLVACLAGCYLPSAGRRAGRILERGWDPHERGVLMILTGPVSLLHAGADFLVHALVPLDYDGYFLVDRREPPVQWFRRYGGPMLPLSNVAILCHEQRATFVEAIRDEGGSEWRAARDQNWQFPKCIEVLPGRYQIAVSYLLRKTDDARDAKTTTHVESTEPSTVAWTADSSRKAEYRDRNIYISAKDGSGERQLTTDGSEAERIKYGTASWVYGEELDQTSAMWWSPNGQQLAFYRPRPAERMPADLAAAAEALSGTGEEAGD